MVSSPAPQPDGPTLIHEHGRCLRVVHAGVELVRYVHVPWDDQLEAPRPYLHPIRTLGGSLVSLYRPHDHVWHKGIAWSLPNVGDANFWGGPTYLRDQGYVQLDNVGATRHLGFDHLAREDRGVAVGERLAWVGQQGDTWFTEHRALDLTVQPDDQAWTLWFETSFTNVSGRDVAIGSPTTQGRPNAGYGGLFWRGPRSFTGGTVHTPEATGGDELMGVRAPWMAFVGRHDEHGGSSTLAFVDAPDNQGHPTRWFVRCQPFACVCPAPFFGEEVTVAPDETLTLRYAVVVADGDADRQRARRLAEIGLQGLHREGMLAGDDGPRRRS